MQRGVSDPGKRSQSEFSHKRLRDLRHQRPIDQWSDHDLPRAAATKASFLQASTSLRPFVLGTWFPISSTSRSNIILNGHWVKNLLYMYIRTVRVTCRHLRRCTRWDRACQPSREIHHGLGHARTPTTSARKGPIQKSKQKQDHTYNVLIRG